VRGADLRYFREGTLSEVILGRLLPMVDTLPITLNLSAAEGAKSGSQFSTINDPPGMFPTISRI
jgi:hypothetical protein